VVKLIDRLYAPVWALPWRFASLAWVMSQSYAHLLRWSRLGDAYGSDDMVFAISMAPLNNYVRWSEPTATAFWVVGAVGLGLVGVGGRAAKPGVALYLAGAWALLMNEALNIKAHDRLALWVGLGLLIGPIGVRSAASFRSPFGRWYLLIVYCAIYGSTGILKALHEPGWFDGTVLPKHLTLTNFSGTPLALFMARQHWFGLVGGWWTVLFEVSFPVLVWFKRTNPWLLCTAAVFHVAVAMLMDVGAFSYVSIAGYPVLLHPEVAQRWFEAGRGFWARGFWARRTRPDPSGTS
jgi:hypothetical protein